jgi:6 kDa early secretory antigenic target
MNYADGHVLVTFESIGQAATDCDTMNGEMLQELADLKSKLAPMVSTWSGRAAENYNVLQAQWDTAASDLSDILTQISRSLRVAQQNYTDTETANASIWQT